MSMDIGQVYRASLLVVSDLGAPVNPTAATLTITKPGPAMTQIVQTISMPPAQTGLLTYDYPLTDAGLHTFDWVTTGPGIAQTDYVNARRFRSVLSLAEAKDFLNVRDSTTDQKIRLLMGAATREAERVCGTLVIRRFTDDWVDGTYKTILRLPHGPLPDASSVTSLKSIYAPMGGPSWTAGDMFVNPAAGTVRLNSQLDFWYGPWLATYTAGRTEIPEDTIQGVKEILYDLWATQRGVLQDTAVPDMTEAEQFEAIIPPGWRIPPRALQYLAAEQAPGFA